MFGGGAERPAVAAAAPPATARNFGRVGRRGRVSYAARRPRPLNLRQASKTLPGPLAPPNAIAGAREPQLRRHPATSRHLSTRAWHPGRAAAKGKKSAVEFAAAAAAGQRAGEERRRPWISGHSIWEFQLRRSVACENAARGRSKRGMLGPSWTQAARAHSHAASAAADRAHAGSLLHRQFAPRALSTARRRRRRGEASAAAPAHCRTCSRFAAERSAAMSSSPHRAAADWLTDLQRAKARSRSRQSAAALFPRRRSRPPLSSRRCACGSD